VPLEPVEPVNRGGSEQERDAVEVGERQPG
jgi:hypothetical protein